MASTVLAFRRDNPGHRAGGNLDIAGRQGWLVSVLPSRLVPGTPSLATTNWIPIEEGGGTYRLVIAHIYQGIVGVLAWLDDHPR